MPEINRLYGTNVATSYESAIGHIAKHSLGVTPREYVSIGDQLTGGKQGKFSGTFNRRHFTAIVDGRVCSPDTNGNTAIFGLFRSVRRGS